MTDFCENVFHKIIIGELPSYKIYEDDLFLVIMDLYPANLGHCLILPKKPCVDVFGLDDETAAALYPLAKKIASAVKTATNCDGINIMQNNGKASGQVVFYFHLHVVPRYDGDGIGWHNAKQKDYSEGQFEEMAEKLVKGL